jgi:predicted unusual protein kinase regulating ubiquinone biosynthesis (AarF/ABC1/UbiB family)
VSLHPERLRRYKDVAHLLYKYGKSDLVKRAGLDDAIADETFDARDDGKPEELAADLERLGPAFIKLGQLLSTRADLLPPPYLDAAAGGALWLAFNILTSDRPTHKR